MTTLVNVILSKKTPLGLVNARPSHSLIKYQILVILTWQVGHTGQYMECKLHWNLLMSIQAAAKNPAPWDLRAKHFSFN